MGTTEYGSNLPLNETAKKCKLQIKDLTPHTSYYVPTRKNTVMKRQQRTTTATKNRAERRFW